MGCVRIGAIASFRCVGVKDGFPPKAAVADAVQGTQKTIV